MPDPHKRANRPPNYKTAYRVNNWCEYDQALRNCGDITLRLGQDTTAAWMAPKTGTRGAQPLYSVVCPRIAYTDLDTSFCKAIEEMRVMRVEHAPRMR
jgi:hypothetical protein